MICANASSAAGVDRILESARVKMSWWRCPKYSIDALLAGLGEAGVSLVEVDVMLANWDSDWSIDKFKFLGRCRCLIAFKGAE